MTIRFTYLLFLLAASFAAMAQGPSYEIYAGGGNFSVDDAMVSGTSTFVQFTPLGEDFFIRQEITQGFRRSIIVTPKFAFRIGANARLDVGKRSSFYAGVYLNARRFEFGTGGTKASSLIEGQRDTIPNPNPGGGGFGGPAFCENEPGFFERNSSPRGLMLDGGVQLGYRIGFFKDWIALRAQTSVATPLYTRLRRDNFMSTLTDQNCLLITLESVDINDDYDINPLQFRAGGGLDVRITNQFALGLTVEQQLNSTFNDVQNNELLAIIGTPLSEFRPLTFQLMARYTIF